ncbi:hypothetical protein ONE63_007579 [Megalurothrips usitatus]|uniref:MARVEL domain-containing protein n=1 Tax=Megalurothrips usitatus TaxID=439358 RepID=A0AAV7XSC6_9NEOP|nr:hypothetical protein ONE63_007579 [Megalurothrips usitatus]
MNPNLSAFREPRGVMRILQFVFAICAFSTICGFAGKTTITACAPKQKEFQFEITYPFSLSSMPPATVICDDPTTGQPKPKEDFYMSGDFSSDSQFFVATGVLSFLYCIGIVVVYAMFEEKYQSNSMLPLADFVLTTVLAVLWLSSSAAWANSLSGIKSVTESSFITQECKNCTGAATSSFSSLNISVLLGFLNFFLWASDLWFLYKETHWFKMRQESAGGV